MKICVKGGQVLDPGVTDARKDIIIQDGVIKDIVDPGQGAEDNCQIIDAENKIVVPGLIDIHVHLREPGQEHKETIETGLKAAAKGGFTAVCSMPNTSPVNDTAEITSFIIRRGNKAAGAKVYPAGAITTGLESLELAPIADMKQAGIAAVTDDGRPVESPDLMEKALVHCNDLQIPVFVHAEELSLVNGGAMNEGSVSKAWGIKGIPNTAESVMVERDIELAGQTDSKVHFCHISTKESVDAIRRGKKDGVKVTCETAPHYFLLTDDDIPFRDTHFKMNPPLRSKRDKEAIIEGLKDGTIDLIASDHAPHSPAEKEMEFEFAAFGIVGIETSLPLSLRLVHDNVLTLPDLVKKMSKKPAEIIGINNDLVPGNTADITVIDPEKQGVVDPEQFISKSKNTPFPGWQVKGCAVTTIVNGQVVYSI